jgi:uncharacterized membrane protein
MWRVASTLTWPAHHTITMAELLRRAPPILIYTTISAGLLAVVVARALDTYQNFFASAFALSHSNGSILVSELESICSY